MEYIGGTLPKSLKKRKRSNDTDIERDTIVKADCLEFMKTLPDECIDATITSPPYNKYGFTMPRLSVKYKEFNDKMSMSDYKKQQIQILNELYRLTKPGGHCFYIHKVQYVRKNCTHPIEWILQSDWNVRQEIVWVKSETQYNTNPYRFSSRNSRIYWLYKPVAKKLRDDENIFSLERSVNKWTDVWFPPNDLGAKHKFGKFDHPCMFPIFLVVCILHSLRLKPGSLVFDPYIGSGTTAKAASFLGLDYLGCDIVKEYVSLAKKRLSKDFDYDVYSFNIFKKMMRNDTLDLSLSFKFRDYE